MYSVMTWTTHPLNQEQEQRMMSVWGKIEADMAGNTSVERICWLMYADGSGGVNVNKLRDVENGLAFEAEVCLALGEFLDIQTRAALDLDTAMPAILKAIERATA